MSEKETDIKYPGAIQRPNNFWEFISDNKLKGISKKHCITAHASSYFSNLLWESDDEYIEKIMSHELSKIISFRKITTKIHKWKYAKPERYLDCFFKEAKKNNLIIAGEVFGGNKLEGAFLSGLNAGKHLLNIF